MADKKANVKTDTILKEFWRDNERFADLFNAALFGGRCVIRPEFLEESDTDLSGVIRLKGQGETLHRILDAVKKSTAGVDFIILGVENQQHVHYGMPLRIMVGDALGYLKEYEETSKKNRSEKRLKGSGEFLSGLRREDRLHPMVTLCVYYGQDPWDGPFALKDMLEIPEEVDRVVSDYRIHLVQVVESDELRFHNDDVRTVFDICRRIYKKDYKKIQELYGEKELKSELGLVVGAVTETRELMNHALARKGGAMNMCRALEELKQEGKQEGKILARYEDGMEPEAIAARMGLPVEQVEKVLEENLAAGARD